jgi:hypothetical protein
LNDDALEGGTGLLSQYLSQDGTTFWVLTKGDRSVTTILLPNEY